MNSTTMDLPYRNEQDIHPESSPLAPKRLATRLQRRADAVAAAGRQPFTQSHRTMPALRSLASKAQYCGLRSQSHVNRKLSQAYGCRP
jgi:hypothetical protein